MIAALDTRPAYVSSAPIPSRNVMVWGNEADQAAMLKMLGGRGWKWAALLLGGKTPALLLTPPRLVPDDQITALIAQINSGKFGKLNAGYGQLGSPDASSGSTNS